MPTNHILRSPGAGYELVEHHAGLNFEIYRTNFASYLFTHVRGYRELIEVLALDPKYASAGLVAGLIRAQREQSSVPVQWKNALSTNGDWTRCHGNQIDRIIAGRPARLDRNLQAILALALLFKQSDNAILREVDIYQYVRLVPAVYAIRNLLPAANDWLKGRTKRGEDSDSFEALLKMLCPAPEDAPGDQIGRAKAFLEDVADGYPLTCENATLIHSRLKPEWRGAKVQLLNARTDGFSSGRRQSKVKLRCCNQEAEFIKLDPALLAQLPSVVRSRQLFSERDELPA